MVATELERLEEMLNQLKEDSVIDSVYYDLQNQIFMCASINSLNGNNKKAVNFLLKSKKIAESFNYKYFSYNSNHYFYFDSHLLTKNEDEKSASVDLKMSLSHLSKRKLGTFLEEGDIFKFTVVPFSKISLLNENNIDQIEQISKTDNSLFCFQYQITKENTICDKSDNSNRIFQIQKQFKINGEDNFFVLKCEVFKDHQLFTVNFLLMEFESGRDQFKNFIDTFDFFSYFEKL